MELFAWFENTAFSVWVRESPPVFPSILIAHALGMGALVGVNVFIAVQALGRAPAISRTALDRFLPIMWAGFIASSISGLLLLAGYPAKALTNPVFYAKFLFIGLAVFVSMRLRARFFESPGTASVLWVRATAASLLVLWGAAIAAGRFLAYTHDILLASHQL